VLLVSSREFLEEVTYNGGSVVSMEDDIIRGWCIRAVLLVIEVEVVLVSPAIAALPEAIPALVSHHHD